MKGREGPDLNVAAPMGCNFLQYNVVLGLQRSQISTNSIVVIIYALP
jgi:hypothetical protein